MSSCAAEGEYILTTEGDLALKIYADADRISQVLVKFVNNAVKYAPKSMDNPINIEIVGNMAKVSVSDKGGGIHKKLFLIYLRDTIREIKTGLHIPV